MLEEELGVSVQLANGNEDEVLSKDVQNAIEQVMNGNNGEEMRKRATVIAEKINAAMKMVITKGLLLDQLMISLHL
ncbi:hypothetical protein C5167_012155 [Papaver somniferum]|uniref:Uncharacterized protein n=1 Tax=Papaver somniferum TaxID=3469 RepID=A0A4Y7J0L4_PAPSO|nr:hypothetical protein C5167_012155 [Papaver somniferum]